VDFLWWGEQVRQNARILFQGSVKVPGYKKESPPGKGVKTREAKEKGKEE
jgi:hypothetical protein